MNIEELPFSLSEYNRRLLDVREIILRSGLDALLCHTFSNICYLTGLQSVMGTEKYRVLHFCWARISNFTTLPLDAP